MQQSYLLSNKENDYVGERPSYRAKLNYQQREKYYERSKSPLGENSHRFNFCEIKENFKAPTPSKRRDFSYKYADESTIIQPFGHRTDQNNLTINNNRQSVSDLSKIKPISLENNRNQQKLINKTFEREPLQDKQGQNDYRTYSRSAHRQNSKHLNFVAKVDNLQKINNQITSLLSYVYENKSVKKQNDVKEFSASSKQPRYGMISQNSKSYQRRLNTLQKPKANQPTISVFQAQNAQTRLTPSNKQKIQPFEHKELSNKSLQKININDINTRQNRERTPRSAIKMDLSPKNFEVTKIKQNNQNVSPLKTVKSQQFSHLMTPSESLQKLSKITTGNNPDLQFYYQSLKKRDQDVQKFQRNYCQEFQKDKQNSKSRNLRSYSNFIKNDNNQQKSLERKRGEQKNKVNLKQEINFPEKNTFVTEQQIQVYKDISRLKRTQNQRVSSTKRIQNLRAQISRSENQRALNVGQPFFPNKKQKTLSSNDILKMKVPQNQDTFNLRSQKLKIEPDFCAKIQDQMTKIQNQLKQCQNEKNFFRGKYSNLLTKQKSGLVQKADPFDFNEVEKVSQKNQDKERMYDSSSKKAYKQSSNYKLQNDDQFHRDLRKRMISHNQTLGNQQSFRNESLLFDEKSFCHRNLSNKKPIQMTKKNVNDTSFTHDFGQNRDVKTPSNVQTVKKFEIMLQKVQVTKPQTTKLGALLAQKIELDMKLREQRQKFWKNKNPNKWEELRQHLSSRYGMSRNTRQWQELLSISPEEHNPFSPTQMSSNLSKNLTQQIELQRDGSTEQDILLLASLLAESLNYFDSQLLHNFSEEKLNKQHFTFRELDLSSKGYLSLEDLICFINLHSGKFYRNRDAIFLVKSMMLFHKDLFESHNNSKEGIQSYHSQKGGNGYKISYNFLWRIFTDKK